MFNLETHDELKDFLKNWVVLYVTDIGITSSVLHQLTDEVAYRYRGNACMQGKRGNAGKLGNRGNACM